jgi:hypothetical protein
MDDLIELKNYIKNKHNINVFVNESKNNNILCDINIVYVRLIIIIIIMFVCWHILYSNKKNINKITFIILVVLFIVLNIYYLQKYIIMIYIYNKNNNKYDNIEIKHYNEIQFNTGDVLQGIVGWNSNFGVISQIFGIEYLHNLIVIKFKNIDYALHFTNNNFGYPKNIISFEDNNSIEIFKLDDYLKNKCNVTKYYRLFQIKNAMNNDDLFNVIKKWNLKKFKFTFMPCFANEEKCNNKYNCMSFILKILIDLRILRKFNVNTFVTNDLIYLPELSNNLYKNNIIIKHKM